MTGNRLLVPRNLVDQGDLFAEWKDHGVIAPGNIAPVRSLQPIGGPVRRPDEPPLPARRKAPRMR
jgi:hypothetical protein